MQSMALAAPTCVFPPRIILQTRRNVKITKFEKKMNNSKKPCRFWFRFTQFLAFQLPKPVFVDCSSVLPYSACRQRGEASAIRPERPGLQAWEVAARLRLLPSGRWRDWSIQTKKACAPIALSHMGKQPLSSQKVFYNKARAKVPAFGAQLWQKIIISSLNKIFIISSSLFFLKKKNGSLEDSLTTIQFFEAAFAKWGAEGHRAQRQRPRPTLCRPPFLCLMVFGQRFCASSSTLSSGKEYV